MCLLLTALWIVFSRVELSLPCIAWLTSNVLSAFTFTVFLRVCIDSKHTHQHWLTLSGFSCLPSINVSRLCVDTSALLPLVSEAETWPLCGLYHAEGGHVYCLAGAASCHTHAQEKGQHVPPRMTMHSMCYWQMYTNVPFVLPGALASPFKIAIGLTLTWRPPRCVMKDS